MWLQLVSEGREGGREGKDGTSQVVQDLVGLREHVGPSQVQREPWRAVGNRRMCMDSGAHRGALWRLGDNCPRMRAEGAVLIQVEGWPRVVRGDQTLDMFKDRATWVS